MAKNKQFLVIGLGKFGFSLAKTLYENGADVLAIDKEMDLVNDVEQHCTQALCMDATDEKALQKISVNKFDTCIVSFCSDVESNIYICLSLLQAGVKNIIAKARDDKHRLVLQKLGVEHIIIPEEEMSKKVALNLLRPNMIEVLSLGKDFSIVEIKTPPAWVGKTIVEMDLRNKEHINVLAINKGNEAIHPPHIGEYKLCSDDILVISGTTADTVRVSSKATKSIVE